MTPTQKLRFVQRKEENWPIDCQYPTIRNVKILQQWWEDKTIALTVYRVDADGNSLPPLLKGEWRDIPLETEE